MRKLLLVPALAAALFVAACGAQTQAPQIDQAAANQSLSTVQSQDSPQPGDDSSNGGTTIENNVRTDDSRNRSSRDDRGRDDDSGDRGRDDRGRDDGAGDADDNLQPGQPLPAGFPLPVPDEYEVQVVGTAGDETSVTLRVPSGEDAYNYYRQALADEGFLVVDEGRNQDVFFEADLEFSDNIYEGGMEFDGDMVEIEVERHN